MVIVHKIEGRVRFRTNPDTLKGADISPFTNILTSLDGIKSVSVNPRTGSILVSYDEKTIALKGIRSALQKIKLKKLKSDPSKTDSSLVSYALYLLVRFLTPAPLKPLITVLGAVPFLLNALRSLKRGELDVAVLDAAAISCKLLQRDTASASTLMMLLKTACYLEEWAKSRARENLASSLALNVGTVWIVGEDGREKPLPFKALSVGDTLLLRAGSLIPADGVVLKGNASVNETALTGEPIASHKREGSSLHAGTVVEEGELYAKVLKVGENTRYAQIIKLIEGSEKLKAGAELRALKIADKAVPFTFLLAFLAALLSRNPSKAAAVLSVDYSCAIKLSVPLLFLSAMREGLSHGVFFKGGGAMECLAEADTIVFDKTGTLTAAKPVLLKVAAYNGFSEDEALKIAACLEEHFPHPVAHAVTAAAEARKLRHEEEHSTVKHIAAHGIASLWREKEAVIGSRHFVEDDMGVDISIAEDASPKWTETGASVLYLAVDRKLAAVLLIDDPLREESEEVVQMLYALKFKRIYLLSGDSDIKTKQIARKLKLTGGIGELLPKDKADIVKNLRAAGCKTAFVGDGMNDSPAMAEADVSIAMKDGADLAREVADITLKEGGLYPLIAARILSERALAKAESTVSASLALNSAFLLPALFSSAVTGGALMWLHNLTTLGLSLNAMRPLLKE